MNLAYNDALKFFRSEVQTTGVRNVLGALHGALVDHGNELRKDTRDPATARAQARAFELIAVRLADLASSGLVAAAERDFAPITGSGNAGAVPILGFLESNCELCGQAVDVCKC